MPFAVPGNSSEKTMRISASDRLSRSPVATRGSTERSVMTKTRLQVVWVSDIRRFGTAGLSRKVERWEKKSSRPGIGYARQDAAQTPVQKP